MPMTLCDAAALVPATATTQAHVHQCNRRVPAAGFPHLGQHHCRECRTSFIVTPASAPTATEKCEACGAIQPTTNLREMYPEHDVTQYVCLDTAACSARVAGRQQTSGGRWPLSAEIQAVVDAHTLQRHPGEPCQDNTRGECRATFGDVVNAPLVEPLAQLDPAAAVEGLAGAIGIIRGLRDVVDDMPRGTVGRVTLQRHLAQLERQLVEYRPPVAELTELTLEPGVVEEVADIGRRVTELERAVADLISRQPPPTLPPTPPTLLHVTPTYVHRLLDAFLTHKPLDFNGAPVPLDVQRRLEDALPEGVHLIAVRTADGRVHHPHDVQLVYGP